MTKKWRKILTFSVCSILLTSTVALGIRTFFLTNKKEVNKPEQEQPLKEESLLPIIEENKTVDSYPENSSELKKLQYPFGNNEDYKYLYANIHRFLFNQPQWDNLINYRNVMADFSKRSNQFEIKEDVLNKNLRNWLIQAIYAHPYFKAIKKQLSLDIDYDVNVPVKRILINAVWWFENDRSSSELPKRYWDQIKVNLIDRSPDNI